MPEFYIPNSALGVSISQDHIETMANHVAKSFPLETGGIIVGYYTEDLSQAVICLITGPPPDSVHGRYTFKRGTKGLKEILKNAQSEKQFYLGEWHLHPNGTTEPSCQDVNQMKDIAGSKAYNCPEPIMIIIAGNAIKYEIGVFLAKRKPSKIYELVRSPNM